MTVHRPHRTVGTPLQPGEHMLVIGFGPVAARFVDDVTDLAARGGESRMTPDSTICHCAGVTTGRITDVVEEGAATVEEVGCATRAFTGCGGRRGAVRRLMEEHAAAAVRPAGCGRRGHHAVRARRAPVMRRNHVFVTGAGCHHGRGPSRRGGPLDDLVEQDDDP